MQRQIDLPDQHAMIELVDHAPHLGDDLMHFRLVGGILRQDFLVRRPAFDEMRVGRIIAKFAVLDQMPDHIDPEAIDTPAEPEAHHVVDRLAHLRIAPVQVRLLAEKGMVIILTRRLVILPGAAAEFRQPVIRRAALRRCHRARRTSRAWDYRARRGFRRTTDADRTCGSAPDQG